MELCPLPTEAAEGRAPPRDHAGRGAEHESGLSPGPRPSPRTWPRSRVFGATGLLLGATLAGAVLVAQARGLADTKLGAALLLAVSALLLALVGFVSGRESDRALHLSVTDPLTGLFNRRELRARLGAEMKLGDAPGTLGMIVAVDVDRMKAINDQYGHLAGDRALKTVARAVRECLGPEDVAARVGGDEFAILMLRRGATEASHVARMIIERLAEYRDRLGIPVSVSIGMAPVEATTAVLDEDVLGLADQALYQAKASGRGRATLLIASPGSPAPADADHDQDMRSRAQGGRSALSGDAGE